MKTDKFIITVALFYPVNSFITTTPPNIGGALKSVRLGDPKIAHPSLETKLSMARKGFSQRKSPMKYLRIQPKSLNRNKKKHRVFELQTAVTTLGKKLEDGTDIAIDLHAQVGCICQFLIFLIVVMIS